MRTKAHLRRQIIFANLQKDAKLLSLADVAERIRKIPTVSDEDSKLGDELKSRDFTKFFADKQAPQSLKAWCRYTLQAEMRKLYTKEIRRAKKGKAAGPDGAPMELLQINTAAFAETFYELFTAGDRIKCVMKGLGRIEPHLHLQE